MQVEPTPTGGRIVLDIFLILAGAVIFAAFFVLPVWRWSNARSWEPCSCTVVSSKLNEHRSHSSSNGHSRTRTTYSVAITYTYTYNGQAFTSKRYNFFSGSSSRYFNRKIIAQYPAGSEGTCYVDPDNPKEAVLSIEFSYFYLFGLAGVLFIGAGVRNAIKRREDG